MILYDKEKNKINYHLLDKIGKGSNAKVYKLSDLECIKIFNILTNDVDIDTISFIQDLSLPNFYQINKFLFDKNNNFKAYTMKYYQSTNSNILLLPTSYTLDNFYYILTSSNILSENHIFMSDTHSDNIILTTDKIIIIDTDLYAKSLLFNDYKLKNQNTKAIYYLFYSLYMDALDNLKINSKDNILKVKSLFTYPNSKENVHKVLTKYKYPIDYIKH